MLTHDLVKEYFRYDKNTGFLYKIKKTNNRDRINVPLAEGNKAEYLRCRFKKKSYQIHSLIYFIEHGIIPDLIDHIDGDKHNNKLENLRPCTNQQNQFNRPHQINNKLGIKGVCFYPNRKLCYRSFIKFNRKTITLGSFATIEEAIAARQDAEIKYFGEFRRGGLDTATPVKLD